MVGAVEAGVPKSKRSIGCAGAAVVPPLKSPNSPKLSSSSFVLPAVAAPTSPNGLNTGYYTGGGGGGAFGSSKCSNRGKGTFGYCK